MTDPWQPQDPQPAPFVPPPLPPLPTDPVSGAVPGVPAESTAAQVPTSISVKRLIQIIAGVAVALVVGWVGWSQYSDYRDAKKLDALTSEVQESMQHKFDTDPALWHYQIRVDGLGLIKETDTKYSGMATVHTLNTGERQVSIEVKADGSSMMWKADPGAFLFLFQEQLQEVFGKP